MTVDLERALASAAAPPRRDLDLGLLERRLRRRRRTRRVAVALVVVLVAVLAASVLPLSRQPQVLLDSAAASPSAWPLQVRGQQYSYEEDGSYRVRTWELAGTGWEAVTIVQVAARDVDADGHEGPLSRRGELLEQRGETVAAGHLLVRDPQEPFSTVRDALAGDWLWRAEDPAIPSPPEQLLGWVDASVVGHEGDLELVADTERDLLEEVAANLGVDEGDLVALRSRDSEARETRVRGVRHGPSGLPLRVLEVRGARSRPIIEVTDLDLRIDLAIDTD